MFYDVGFSAAVSNRGAQSYWGEIERAARNEERPPHPTLERYPRGMERRHFRGTNCIKAVQQLAQKFPKPEDAVSSLLPKRGDMAIMEKVKQWPMFGNWIAFKVVDMLERCAGVKCEISVDLVLMYEEPYKALEMLTGGSTDVGAEFAEW
jgi:hypothetical protein